MRIPFTSRLVVSDESDGIHVRVTGCDSLNEHNVETITNQLNDLVDERRPQIMRLDLSDIGFLTSTALGKLVGLNKKLRGGGGRLTLVNPTETVQEIFTV